MPSPSKSNTNMGFIKPATGASGSGTTISSNSTIEHHNKIGVAFCCGPSFSTSGIVEIGNLVRTGINVGIEPFVKIGDEVVLASGTIITKNVENFEIIKSNK